MKNSPFLLYYPNTKRPKKAQKPPFTLQNLQSIAILGATATVHITTKVCYYVAMKAFIGIDVGGTKTLGVAIDENGNVLKQSLSTAANYQAVGLKEAGRVIYGIVSDLVKAVHDANASVKACAYGLSGLDRPADEKRLRALLKDIHPGGAMVLVNDAFLILRAGTMDGVGVGVVSGTGSNSVGRGPDGRMFRIGGLCYEMGDAASGWDIAVDGLRAAKRGRDSRGPATAIHDLILEAFGLQHIDDAMDFIMDGQDPGLFYFRVTPLVFRAAAQGDLPAQKILIDAGQELGHSVSIVSERFFTRKDRFNCVLGGSVMLTNTSSLMRKALEMELHRSFPSAVVSRIPCQPVCGALLMAVDEVLERDRVLSLQKKLIKELP